MGSSQRKSPTSVGGDLTRLITAPRANICSAGARRAFPSERDSTILRNGGSSTVAAAPKIVGVFIGDATVTDRGGCRRCLRILLQGSAGIVRGPNGPSRTSIPAARASRECGRLVRLAREVKVRQHFVFRSEPRLAISLRATATWRQTRQFIGSLRNAQLHPIKLINGGKTRAVRLHVLETRTC